MYGMISIINDEMITLPLLTVRSIVTLNDISASVLLTQTYLNNSLESLEVTYKFPIPDRAVVNSFTMIKSNGSRIVGIVEGKDEAKIIYDEAVNQGKLSSLMELVHEDVFQVTLGNIEAKEEIKIELNYVTELTTDEENDSIRFHLPVSVGARYGDVPFANESNCDAITLGTIINAFELTINIEMSNQILKIGSPSHTIETEFIPTSITHKAIVKLLSRNSLDKDFILTLKSASLDLPRGVAEIHPENGTLALGISLVPRFNLKDIQSQEYIFVVDRSGSMGGSRIQMAKDALIIMLRSLPHQNTYFQIVSFGSHHSSIWNESKPYNQSTLMQATEHVENFDANFGGTEIRSALEFTFNRRRNDRPTSVFLLTDGDAWDVEKVVSLVQDSTSKATVKNSLRVFTFGIGDSTSTAMIDGIARNGNGICSYAVDGENFTGKVARLLKASKTPLISDIKIDWGFDEVLAKVQETEEEEIEEPFEIISDEEKVVIEEKLSFFDLNANPIELEAHSGTLPPPSPIKLSPSPLIQQSPFKLYSIVPGNRLSVYSIISSKVWFKGDPLPKVVTLSGKLESGQVLEVVIPITFAQLVTTPSPIHTLAAKKLIQDFENGRSGLLKAESEDSDIYERTLEAEVVRLGKTYSIGSKFTSFIAVDESEIRKPRKVVKKPKPYQAPMPMMYCMASAPSPYQTKLRSTGPAFGASAPGIRIKYKESPIPTPPLPTVLSPPTLTEIAKLQEFDGSFEIKVISLTRIILSTLIDSLSIECKNSLGSTLEKLLATSIGLLYLQKKITEPKENWEGMYLKGLDYFNLEAGRFAVEIKTVVDKFWNEK